MSQAAQDEHDMRRSESTVGHLNTASVDNSKGEANIELEDTSKGKDLESTEPDKFIHGARLYLISAAICLSLFLSSIEVPIVSTSVVSITNALHGFDQSGWIVTAYLITYVAFLMVWATLSEIFGRKSCVIAAMAIFIIFSGACGAAQTITQLIVFRALQGVGGSGIYTIPFGVVFELVPPQKYPLWGMILSMVFTLTLLFGPIWGGAINDADQWRWVFLFNVPAGFVAGMIWLAALPSNFPHHHANKPKQSLFETMKGVLKIDYLGVFLLLGGNVLLIAALQEAGVKYPWRSAYVIVLLVLSGLLWIGLVAWAKILASRKSNIQPVLPWRLMNRGFLGIAGSIFFLGTIFAVTIYLIPQRYIVVNNLSPLQAGLRLIPFTVLSPFASIIGSILSKKKIPLLYIVIAGNCFQILGFGLLTTLPVTEKIWAAQYGFEILAGFGVGLSLVILTIMVPLSVPAGDKGIGNGTFNQARYLGGAISLAIIVSVLNGYLSSHLSGVLEPDQVSMLLQTNSVIQTLDPPTQELVREIFGRAYNVDMKILVCLSAAQMPWSILMWRKKQLIVE